MQLHLIDAAVESDGALPTTPEVVFITDGEKLVALSAGGGARGANVSAESTVDAMSYILNVQFDMATRLRLTKIVKEAIGMGADLIDVLGSDTLQALLQDAVIRQPRGGALSAARIMTPPGPMASGRQQRRAATHVISVMPSRLRRSRLVRQAAS